VSTEEALEVFENNNKLGVDWKGVPERSVQIKVFVVGNLVIYDKRLWAGHEKKFKFCENILKRTIPPF